MKGQFNKPICAITISVVMLLSTIAIAMPYQEASAGVPPPSFRVFVDVLDKNGQLVDNVECVVGSGFTTVTIFMRGKTSLDVTVNNVVVESFDKPGKAQRLIAVFEEETGLIDDITWRDGKGQVVENITIPSDANDFHVVAKKIVLVNTDCSEALDVSGKGVTTVNVRSFEVD